MASSGPLLTGFADQFGDDLVIWEEAGFLASDGSDYANCDLNAATIRDHDVRITLTGNSVTGDNKANENDWASLVDETVTYGGPTELWGRTWSLADIKDNVSFGLAISIVKNNDPISYDPSNYLYGNDFAFDGLPEEATIVGVEFTVKRQMDVDGDARIKALRATVYYTTPGAAGASHASVSCGLSL